jgi:hypothetical protein
MIILGNQYTEYDNRFDHSGFKAKARLHQSKYRAEVLKLPYEKYGNYLKQSDAEKGKNFYPDFNIFFAVKSYRRYGVSLYSNMLRSEHIPFNFFVPLRYDLDLCKTVFNSILPNCIKSIPSQAIIDTKENIKIEFAPKPKENFLDDRTSFDAYIEYDHIDGSKGIIGIEVKYTELGYKISGQTEANAIKNLNSKYYAVSEKCGIFDASCYSKLILDDFRQIWRNHILGESIVQVKSDKFKHFTSVLFFPEGNKHFGKTTFEYNSILKKQNVFIPVKYEDYFHLLKTNSKGPRFDKWIDYLHKRYLVS